MKRFTLNETLSLLLRAEKKSRKENYLGDAANWAFKRHILILLNEIAKKRSKKRPSAWNLFVADYLKRGKTVKDAAEDWKKKKK